MDAGFLDEVRDLASRPEGLSRSAAQALGYRELLAHLRGEASLDEALAVAVRRTKRFARRQRAWFHRDPRIAWLDVDDPAKAVAPLGGRLEDS
jgi:tRNA dimethylallyltransferase